jgi:signal transduction histidine kinase
MTTRTAASDWTGPAPAWPRARTLALWVAFVIAYCLLDRLDLMRTPLTSPLPLADLAGGLALALMVWQGPRLAPLVIGADLLSNLIGPVPALPIAALVCSALALGGCYAVAAIYLRRFSTGALDSQRGLLRLIGAGAVATLGPAVADLAVVSQWGGVAEPAYLTILARAWSGNFIGVAVMAPLVASIGAARTWLSRREAAEFAAQLAVLVLTLVLIGSNPQADRFRYFYLLFLPQIWLAVRFGVTGAATGHFIVQLGLNGFFLTHHVSDETTFSYDVRLITLTMSTLFLGCAVNERRTAEAVLRQRQDEFARVSRLSLAGELAAALAHQLNQPLLATIAFTRAAQRFMETGEGRADAAQAMNEAVAQAERAGEIVRTLRRFIGKGEIERRPCSPSALARDAITLVEPECARAGIRIVTAIDRNLAAVQVDAVQIQQVLLNLIQNAVDALDQPHITAKIILLSARRASDRMIEIEVCDTGPGLSAAAEQQLFEPFSSDKDSGMGLGLVICRGIVEAHAGRLWLEQNQPGRCVFRFTLPIARIRTKVTTA